MKVCFIGLGSIGKQHAHNLAHVLQERGESFRFDALRTLGGDLPQETAALFQNEYSSFDVLPRDYDVLFITNPTSLHFDVIRRALEHTKHMFIEKPVFDHTGYPWQSLPWREGGVYYVACPLRYHKTISYMKQLVTQQKVYSARCICSSYLPDWRPDIDYRQCYSARAELGGGVRIDLIHEWDYLNYLFGVPDVIEEFHGTFSELEITSEDIAVYIAKYPGKLLSLHLDYFGRARRREIEVFLENDVVVGDLYEQKVSFLHSGKRVELPQTRLEMQQDELRAFLDMVAGAHPNTNTVEDAVRTLNITLGEGFDR
jgi:predicted dehydrogenase